MRTFKLLTLLLIFPFLGFGQTGGKNTYDFLELETSARQAALGGSQIAVKDDDLSLAKDNPSLLSAGMSQNLSLNYVLMFAGVNYGSASFAHHVDSVGTFAANLDFINYGKFDRRDHQGNKTGEFTASDYVFSVGGAKQLDSNFSIGANVKMIYSNLESYFSYGTAVDLSGTYYNRELDLVGAVVVRNLGYQLKSYLERNREPIPYEIQMGISQNLKYAPIRLTLIGQELQRWDLTYEDPYAKPNVDPVNQQEEEQKDSKFLDFSDKLMRHIILSGEVMLTDNFMIRIGYDYRRRQEMKLFEKPGFVGFSYGLGVKFSRFHISYGRASYHLSGALNHFTVTTDLSGLNFRK